MYRRIVTDGDVFRVQFRATSVSEWGFYPQMHVTRELAQQELDELVARDAREAPSRWAWVGVDLFKTRDGQYFAPDNCEVCAPQARRLERARCATHIEHADRGGTSGSSQG